MSVIIDHNKTNRVMIMAGRECDASDRMFEMVSALCIPRGYEMVRVTGDKIADELKTVYEEIKNEPVLNEIIGHDKKTSKDIYVKEKFIFVFAYADACRQVMEAYGDKKIDRFYLVAPQISGMFDDRTKKWTQQTEILVSKKDDRDVIKECKRMCRRYTAHMSMAEADAMFAGDNDPERIRDWLTGKRNKTYGGNRLLPIFLALGFALGYFADIILRQNGIVLSNRIPVGSIVGLMIVLLIEEIWRRH